MGLSNLTNHINDLSENTQAYVKSMLEYYKLDAFKKMVKGSSMLVKFLVFGSIFLLFTSFISVGLAVLIGNALESLALGFFIIGGIYLVIFLLIFFFIGDFIDKIMLKRFSKMIFNQSTLKDVLDEPLEDKIEE